VSDQSTTEPDDSPPSFTPAYSRYVLVVLFLVYVSNFVDRQILSILLADRFAQEAVRYSLLIVGLTNVVATGLYVMAGRHIREDLARSS
jgi:hypothetical protein